MGKQTQFRAEQVLSVGLGAVIDVDQALTRMILQAETGGYVTVRVDL